MRCLLALVLTAVLGRTVAELERTFRVPESARAGHVVGHLQYSPSAPDKVNFYIVFPPESGVEDALAVSDTTGEIRTRSALDYETKSSYVFLAIPTDGSAGIRVTVSVIDENDNAPVFPVPSIDVQLSEYARVNAEMPLPSATDADFDNFGVQEYRIASGNVNNAFRLATRKLNGILYVDLIVNAELDREYRDRYQLAVEAVDGGNPPKIGQLLVNVSIIDANDNPPQFSQPRYLAHIERNTTVGTAVIAVSATDADIGPNGQVEYRLLPNPGDSHKRFSVDPKSGTISLAEPLTDQPAVKNYELLVVARDFGQPLPLESTAFVTVTIMNNKDGAAKIRTIYLSQEGTSTVSEGAQIGDMVARFSVDWDGREHMRAARSTVNMTLSGGGSFFSLQAADAAVFVLVVTKRLDRETLAAFDLMVIATDSNGRLAHQNVTLLVTDVNDNTPHFTEAVYEAEVREKSPKGSSVIRVTANDADEGENARISYTLSASPPFDKWFQIDADTGLITSMHAVDCEVSSKPELVVVATDHGRPPLSAKAKIVVSVLDINDNSPLFEKSVYNASLAEDTEVGTCFLKVQATDPDCGVNANVRYSLVDHPSTKRVFSIDDATGTICLDAPLDFEQRRRYQLTVIAQDGGGLSSTALVDVHVEDRDDNAPIFYPSMYNISVRENAPTGSPLLIVSATDRDEGVFGQITYRLSSPSPLFRIDARSGELYVQGQLFPDIYKLGVLATDGGGMSSVEPAAVNVAVLREGFVSPNFESKIYRFTASEDTMPGISIGRVKATGPEPIVYDVYSGDPNGEFKVDRTTGELLIVKYIDADERQSVLLNIQAAMGTPPSYNHTQVIISIEDVNDNSPEFEMAVVKTTVREDQPAHEPFFAVQATDKDRHKNGEITYRLLSSDPVGPFLVRPLSGQISLTNKIDYESINFYRLVIGAIDGGIPPRSANITVELTLLDENDHPPKFVIDAYHVEIAEDVRAMTNLVQLNATDQDTGPNGEVSFGLKDDADGLFGIMADSGWVYVRKSLDRETKAEHVLIATATDHGDPPKSSQSSITVVLKDVNDRSPNCTSVGPYTTLENAPANTLIGVIRATDPDLGENGTVFYRLDRSYGDLFRIESSGEIYSKKPLDAETQNEYRIDVTAQDNGSPQLSTNCQIIIHVLDLNDNAPYFILPHQNKVSIREEQPIGTEVVQVRASDPDQGTNGTITYSLVGTGLGASVFRIDGKTGVVTTAAVLDFETLSLSPSGSLELTVKATDGGGLEATKTLIIEIVDVADKARAGSVALITGNDGGNDNVSVAFEVSESAPVGTKLGPLDHARADQLAKVDGNNIDGKLLDVTFDIVSGNSQGLFEIDRLSSVIYVVSRLDYETSPSHALRIARTDLSRPNLPVVSYVSVNVGVLEENDNAPEFLEDPVIFSVAEDAKEGLVVWRFNATDRDVGANGRLLYRIVEQTPVKSFDIEPVTGELWLSKRLDRETVSDYLVIVEASDQAADVSKRRTSKATARVYVTDVNDNVARFTSHDSVVVYEDEIVGSPFFFVVAKDDDWLDNGRIGYKLTSGNDAGFFAINQTTGALSLTKRLNRDSERSFQLGIEAFDHGQEPRSNRQLLTVTVESMNEDAPRFQQSVYRVNVSENAPVGTLVTRLTATDARGATLLFVLPTEGSFALDSTTGNLVTTVPLDREQKNDYSFTVFVRDAKEEHRYDSASVNVHVGDLNDNAPVLATASCQSVSVSENVRYDTLHRFIAFDNDTDINGLVTFSIEGGNDDNKFHVNASTGVLSCEPLDRETKAAYNLTIVAKDNGQPSLQDTCLFQVNVIDQNDMHPVFEKDSYEIEVPENTAAGVAVIRLKAIDHDQGKNGQVLYGLVGESSGQFEIEPVTGDLFVVGRLDFERRNVYTLTVRAMDEGVTEAKYTDANLTLTVTDINDNAPQFANVPIRVNLPTEVASGQLIVQVSAFDQDSVGPNSAVSYGFTEPSTEFAIDSATGIISAQRSMSMLEGANRYLMVTATDNGTPHLSSTGIAEITFGSGTRHPLSIEFNQQVYKADLPESALGGQLVVVCLARRYSNGESDGITYNIVAGNELQAFGIENWSGKVFVADVNKMRSERSRRYSLLVEASASIVNEDNTDAQRLAFALVEIHLVDGADLEPQFLQQRYSTSVSEAKARGEFVIQVAASHRQTPEDARLTYSIVRGNLDSAFTIDETGTVKTNVELDREIQDSYNLTVTATDAQQPPKSTTTSVEVRVQDVNDNRPSFPPVRIVRVSEDTPVGTLLATVTANDVDADSILLYSFVPGVGDGAGMFEIDRLTGRILLAQPFDYERMVGYTLEIEVSDGVNTARTGLKVLVDDENDNAPEFGQPFYQVSLPEDTPAESSIIQVHATDLDSADNGQITYRLVNYTDASNVGFRINETTGAIYTEKALVPGLSKRLLTLLVSATDGGIPAQSALSIVQVRIVSRSEKMQPKFDKDFYSFTISENATLHDVVGQLALANSHDINGLMFGVKSGDPDRMFRIMGDGSISLARPVDREQRDEYHLEISVHTKSNSVANSSASVLIRIEDTNDNIPTFADPKMNVWLNESVAVGEAVLRLSATDRDAGDNGRVVYEMTSGNELGLLALDRTSGTLTLARAIKETDPVFSRFVVRASDQGSPPKSTIGSVSVNIKSNFKSGPFFPVPLYLGRIPESAPVGTLVFTAKATDREGKHLAKLHYSFEQLEDNDVQSEGKKTSLFSINELSGELRTNAIFDYEQKSSYRLSITVKDGAGRSAVVPGQALIKGVDEYAPEFAQKSYAFKVSFDIKPGSVIGSIIATDKDAGADGQVSYSLKEPTAYFAINPATGVLTVEKSLKELSSKSAVPHSSSRSIRSTVAQDDPLKGEITAPKISVVYLTVIAASGVNPSEGMRSEASIVLNLGFFAIESAENAAAFDATIITVVSIILILLLVLVLLFLIFKLRRRKDKNLGRKAAPGTKNVTLPKKKTGPHAGIYAPSTAQSVMTLASAERDRLAPTFHCHPSPVKTAGQPRETLPAPPLPPVGTMNNGRRAPLNSTSAFSNKSSGDEDDELRRLTSRNTDRSAREMHARSMPDSGIDVYVDEDSNSLASSEVPSAREYLTSLGVTEPSVHNRHNINQVVAGGRAEALEMNSAAAARLADDDEADLNELIYSKVNQVLAEDGDRSGLSRPLPDASRLNLSTPPDPMFNSGGTLGRRLKVQQTQPSYQPLTQVFSEISRLRNGSERRPPMHYHSTPVPNTTGRQSPWTPNFAPPVSPTSSNGFFGRDSCAEQNEVEIKI